MGGYIALLAGIGLTAVGCLVSGDPAFRAWNNGYLLGVLFSTWVVNFLAMARVTH
jgi:hypothetical protein